MTDDDEPADKPWLIARGWHALSQHPSHYVHPAAAWMLTMDFAKPTPVLRLGDSAGGRRVIVVNPSRGRIRMIAEALNLPIDKETPS